jgi:phosphoribosylaminoimidazole-succinocarboxamide synthase
MTSVPIVKTEVSNLKLVHRGKVRDVYQVSEDEFLLVATDRISAFDCIMPNPIPGKGVILTQLSTFWFNSLTAAKPHHLITSDFDKMPESVRMHDELRGRSALVKRTEVFPVECVVRGYLEGSGLKDYRENGKVCGHSLSEGLLQCDPLPTPIFTPATKAKEGHDENISEEQASAILGLEVFEELKSRSLSLYSEASAYAREKGIIIADTKFEFGRDSDGNILLIDEILTPDSSRFWPADSYEPGRAQASFDKQFLREYLETLDWDKTPPAPALPEEIVSKTSERYRSAFELLTGNELK